MINKKIPFVLIKTVINWYNKLQGVVRWNGAVSSTMHITSGVRKGGVLSPALFNLYADVLIGALREFNHGCYLKGTFIGCILYADDVLLLSASLNDLQQMLYKCMNVAETIGVKFNSAKSKCIVIGQNHCCIDKLGQLIFCNSVLKWDDKFKY